MTSLTEPVREPGITELLDARSRLMLAVTRDLLLRDPELTLCEGLRLIDAMGTALGRVDSGELDVFEEYIRPHLRSLLLGRFGIAGDPHREIN